MCLLIFTPVCSQSIKNNNVSTIQSVVCNCFNTIKRSLCVNMWQWMKHRSTNSHQSQIGSQLSGQQQVKAIQSDQRCKHQQARFWPLYFRIHKVFCSPITLRKEELSISYKIIAAFEGRNPPKWRQMKKKVFFHQDNAPCHKSVAMMAKLHELHLKLLLHPPYSPDLAPSNYWLFADLKRMLKKKRFDHIYSSIHVQVAK